MTYIFRYLRHSDEVAKQPHSRQAQLDAIDAFIVTAREADHQFARSEVLPEFFDADISGDVEFRKRPAGGTVLGRVAKGDIIIAAAWDRMFRNCRDAENTLYKLDQEGVRLVCLDCQVDTSTAMGRFAARVIIAKGELERTQASERIKSRMKVLEFNRGVKVAKGLPFGWKYARRHTEKKKDGTPYAVYIPDYDCRNLCLRIVQLVDQNKWSYHKTAKFLERNGCKNPRARGENKVKWTYETVANRYLAAKGHFPCKDYDKVTGHNSEQLMVPIEVPAPG